MNTMFNEVDVGVWGLLVRIDQLMNRECHRQHPFLGLCTLVIQFGMAHSGTKLG